MIDKVILILLFVINFYILLGIDWNKIFFKSKSNLAIILCVFLAVTISYCVFSFIRFMNFIM